MMRVTFVLLLLIVVVPALGQSAIMVAVPADDAPTARAVQEAALRYAHINRDEARKWQQRSKLSALVPHLELDYLRRIQSTVAVDIKDQVYVGANGSTDGPDQGSLSQNAVGAHNIGARAVWDLNNLIFNRDQLAASAESRNLVQAEQTLLAEVNRHYFLRRQLAGEVALLRRGRYPLKRGETREQLLFSKEVERGEATAALDALTGGWFSTQVTEQASRHHDQEERR